MTDEEKIALIKAKLEAWSPDDDPWDLIEEIIEIVGAIPG